MPRSRGCSRGKILTVAAIAVLATIGEAGAAPVVLDGDDVGRTFRGIGGLSAGASSRLLYDYPEPQRSDILDYLFKPNFGAALQINKVEIGGDVQSTDGSLPSHMHTADDLDYDRGYIWWLMQEAKKRNPDIKTYVLSWGVPHWVGNGSFFSADNWLYQTNFVKGAKQHGIDVDYIGLWNERSWGSADYVKGLRQTLDSNGFQSTQIIAADGGIPDSEIKALQTDTEFLDSVFGLGMHYPCKRTSPDTLALGLDYWANEDYSTVADWDGAGCWGRSINQNYVLLNATSTISWSTIWSVSPWDIYFGNGLAYAFEPHSGHYRINAPIWTSAHVGQFTAAGWRYLARPGVGMLPGGGSYTTLVPPAATGAETGLPVDRSGLTTTVLNASVAAGDFALVLESMQGNCLRCAGTKTSDQTVSFVLAGSLLSSPPRPLHVWQTTYDVQFQYLGPLTPAPDGSFSLLLPADSMITVTTTTGQGKGSATNPVPPSQAFPLPYSDNYDSTRLDGLGKYHSDQGGSFEIAPACDSANGHVLRQSAPVDAGANAWVTDPLPITMVGPNSARDTVTSINASLVWPLPGCSTRRSQAEADPADGTMVGVCGRVTDRYTSGVCLLVGYGLASSGIVLNTSAPSDSGKCMAYLGIGNPGTKSRTYAAAAAGVPCPDTSFGSTWHRLSIDLQQASATGSIDGKTVLQTSVPAEAVSMGTSALTSGFHLAAFDELEISGAPLTQPRLVSTSVLRGNIRNDFTGEIGMRLTLNHTNPPATPITVTGIGRYCAARANGTHELRIYDATAFEASGGVTQPTLVANATLLAATACSVPALTATGFGYANLKAGVVLKPGSTYFVTSSEDEGGDQFFGDGTFPSVFVRPDLPIFDDQPKPVYRDPTGWHVESIGNIGASYGPLDLLLGSS